MDQLAITFITATTALIAGIASPIVSISIARRQFKVSIISANRERWIEALRESIAEYISLATSVALIRRGASDDITEIIQSDPEARKAAERLVLVKNKILLMTNPTKSYHRELCQSIEGVHKSLLSKHTTTLQKWLSQLDAVATAGHGVLKSEWERVKRGD
jgi:hypothetical protein